jgi:hypothetical protein
LSAVDAVLVAVALDGLRSLGTYATAGDVEAMLWEIDIDNSKSIGYDEFIKFITYAFFDQKQLGAWVGAARDSSSTHREASLTGWTGSWSPWCVRVCPRRLHRRRSSHGWNGAFGPAHQRNAGEWMHGAQARSCGAWWTRLTGGPVPCRP